MTKAIDKLTTTPTNMNFKLHLQLRISRLLIKTTYARAKHSVSNIQANPSC